MKKNDDNTGEALVWKGDADFQTDKYFGNQPIDACASEFDVLLTGRLAGLHEESQALADEFWEFHIKANKTKELKEKSRCSKWPGSPNRPVYWMGILEGS